MRGEVRGLLQENSQRLRLRGVLEKLEIPLSSWYRKAKDPGEPKRRGPKPQPIPESVEQAVLKMAKANPWYGYKRIAVMCRREGVSVFDRQAYRVMSQHDLLQKRRRGVVQLYQASKLYELLPQEPDQLWQMDVTYVHLPGEGWHYVITVIDYYSRYLLACHLTWSYSAAHVVEALEEARREAERFHGPLQEAPILVTDNGSSFLSRRFARHLKDRFTHVRIQYRTPTQLGLLERFHRTMKDEEVYWRLYESVPHARQCLREFRQRYNHRRPHWALIPEEGGDAVTPADVYLHGQVVGIPRWQDWALQAKEKIDALMKEQAA